MTKRLTERQREVLEAIGEGEREETLRFSFGRRTMATVTSLERAGLVFRRGGWVWPERPEERKPATDDEPTEKHISGD